MVGRMTLGFSRGLKLGFSGGLVPATSFVAARLHDSGGNPLFDSAGNALFAMIPE